MSSVLLIGPLVTLVMRSRLPVNSSLLPISPAYPKHIYLSPHLDDAVLSCGGAMRGQALAGDGVQVINVFAGIPDDAGFSAYAERQHRKWGARRDPMEARRTEDEATLDRLGVTAGYWEYLECMYRRRRDGGWLYDSHEAVFGHVAADDDFIIRELVERIRELASVCSHVTVYAPLAVGHHVDHQLVRTAAVAAAQTNPNVLFYEDFPYVARKPEGLEEAQSEVEGVQWIPSLVPIDVEAKISAIAGYRSQIQALFGDPETMGRLVRDYAQSLSADGSCHERYWSMIHA